MTIPPQQTPAPTCRNCGEIEAQHIPPNFYGGIRCCRNAPRMNRYFVAETESAAPPTPVAGETPADRCSCAAWKANIAKVNDPIVLMAIRRGTGGYDGEPFGYCPWCGCGLTSAPKRPDADAVDPVSAANGFLVYPPAVEALTEPSRATRGAGAEP